MSIDLKSVHVRLHPDAHAMAAAIAEIEGKDIAEIIRESCELILLGRRHALTVAAHKLECAGITTFKREKQA